MPNLTIFIPAEKMPSDENLSELTEQCTQLCVVILNAALKNVHVTYVAVRHGRGHPIFAEIKYRIEPFRTNLIMNSFMENLDKAIKLHTGFVARIRCFGYVKSAIYAHN